MTQTEEFRALVRTQCSDLGSSRPTCPFACLKLAAESARWFALLASLSPWRVMR